MSIVKVGFAAAVPGLCGGFGGIRGGVISDRLLRCGHSLSFARKAPIMAGMALSMTMIACNYAQAQSLMLALMSISFFGKGVGAGLDGGLRYLAQGHGRDQRIAVQLHREPGGHHHADRHRLYRGEDQLIRRSAVFVSLLRRAGRDHKLWADRGRDQAGRGASRGRATAGAQG